MRCAAARPAAEGCRPTLQANRDYIPDFIIAIVNDLIRKNFRAGVAVIQQDDIVAAICTSTDFPADLVDINDVLKRKNIVFDKHWMDFEVIFARSGWTVVYDQPSYGDMYDAYFKFITTKK